ncbi:hypothetical protein D3C81_1936440 [compost metagenome]
MKEIKYIFTYKLSLQVSTLKGLTLSNKYVLTHQSKRLWFELLNQLIPLTPIPFPDFCTQSYSQKQIQKSQQFTNKGIFI